MTKEKWLNLQLFGEGGEGGAPAGEGEAETSGDDIPSSIPARARDRYRRAAQATGRTETVSEQADATPAEPAQEELSYADLIKSDKYKADHQAYMDKTIGERLKKYKGIEEKQAKSDELLSIFAQMNGLDSSSPDFFDKAREKLENDETKIEQYAMDHDLSTEEAKRVMQLERRVAQAENQRLAQEQIRQEEEQHARNQERFNRLVSNAEKTKQRFPQFNLEAELQDERFARLCAANNDDTTAAYMACHWNEIIQNTAQVASQQAQIQTANSIASGQNRPTESGLSSSATVKFEKDFSRMNLEQLREYAAQQRNMRR